MTEPSRTIHLAGSTIGCSCHACAFFHDPEEEYRTLLPFVQEGFEAGDRAFQIVAGEQRGERLQRLAGLGVDVAAAERAGQLEVRPWEEAYLRNARFDQHAMLALIEEALIGGRDRGFGLTRLWANMEWALEDLPGVHDLIEYEARLNTILPNYPDVVVCTYDLRRFSAAVVMDILRTHPQVIIGGLLQENPFYVPPAEFLKELAARPRPN
ncbi:MAG TPA: MEDS domain-containing protein [Geminicoccaceae bacterium]|nr:MEDS domain-containing protein [Geminicoccaceae bacterium]